MQKIETRWVFLFLYTSLIFGAILRFAPTIISKSPINDGGMFYVMIKDLKSNHFVIPAFTTYNHIDIPFAYPPLSFYIGGLLSLFGIPILEIMRWIPPLISTISILAFYWMSSIMLDSKSKAALATLAYSMIPRSFSWYIMGGGLSRSFGILFLLLTCASTWALLSRHEQKYIFLAVLFGAGAVLSHPETSLHTLAACILIWIFKGRNLRGLRDVSIIALGVVVITAPWWWAVISQHGLAPLQSALRTGGHDALFWLPWLTFDFAEERFVTLFTVLGLIGVIVQSFRRDWFFLIWLLLAFFIEPRSATAVAALPLAILAGIGLADFIIPGVLALINKPGDRPRDWTVGMAQSRLIRVILAYTILSALIGSFSYDLSLARYVVPIKSKAAMDWVQTNTPPESRFIVLTGATDPFSDPIVEWFPALTNRTSQNTIQGKEWLIGREFLPYLTSVQKLQGCLNALPVCVEAWSKINKLPFDYLYLEKATDNSTPQLLSYQIRQDTKYNLVFENEDAVIFEQK